MERVKALEDWPVPRSVKEVWQVMGFMSYYRQFVYHFAQLAKSLYNLMGKMKRCSDRVLPQCFEWSEECQAVFEGLKK